jgi:hypothetical protein
MCLISYLHQARCCAADVFWKNCTRMLAIPTEGFVVFVSPGECRDSGLFWDNTAASVLRMAGPSETLKPPGRTASLRADIRLNDLSITKQHRQSLHRDNRQHSFAIRQQFTGLFPYFIRSDRLMASLHICIWDTNWTRCWIFMKLLKITLRVFIINFLPIWQQCEPPRCRRNIQPFKAQWLLYEPAPLAASVFVGFVWFSV